MTAHLLDGKQCAEHIKKELHAKIKDYQLQGKRAPGLAVILVGKDTASSIYVGNKRKACVEVGIASYDYDLLSATTEQELLSLIDTLNKNERIDGILVQLPLPIHINKDAILEAIVTHKDVDGFHPYNLGRLAQRQPGLRPCTPLGIMTLLEHYEIDPKGMHAVVVGASNIVGRPMALDLLIAGATVTVCHRFTKDLAHHVHQADLLVVAVGIRNVVDTTWLKPGVIIIDVGMHRDDSGHLLGDIDFKAAEKIASYITPVPGGVGPMTVVSLLMNTFAAYEQHIR